MNKEGFWKKRVLRELVLYEIYIDEKKNVLNPFLKSYLTKKTGKICLIWVDHSATCHLIRNANANIEVASTPKISSSSEIFSFTDYVFLYFMYRFGHLPFHIMQSPIGQMIKTFNLRIFQNFTAVFEDGVPPLSDSQAWRTSTNCRRYSSKWLSDASQHFVEWITTTEEVHLQASHRNSIDSLNIQNSNGGHRANVRNTLHICVLILSRHNKRIH